MRKKKTIKLTNQEMTLALCKKRTDIMANANFPKPKYIEFIEKMLDIGYRVTLYEARKTFSKYVTVYGPGDTSYKVRFSNHKPIRARQLAGDCDFWVGQSYTGKWLTWEHAVQAVKDCFNAL